MNNESNKHSNPIEFVIDFAWACGCDKFTINNAKDELKKLQYNYIKYINESSVQSNSKES